MPPISVGVSGYVDIHVDFSIHNSQHLKHIISKCDILTNIMNDKNIIHELDNLHNKYVIVNAEKCNNNIIIMKKY